MVNTKEQNNAIVYDMLFVDTVDTKIKACNALNAMFVKTVDTGFCIRSTVMCENSTLYKVASCPSKGKDYLKSILSCGFSCSPVSPRRQLC